MVVKKLVEASSPASSVTVCYGYRHDEVAVPIPGEIKDNSNLVFNPEAQNIDLASRPPVAVSCGIHVDGASLPRCDPRDPDTMAAGVQKRFLNKPPPISGKLLRRLRRYVTRQLDSGRFGDPLLPTEDVSFETWIDSVDYPEWRKEELRAVWAAMTDIEEDPKFLNNKSFMKDEPYTDFKHARGINSRSDQFKCFSGPVFRLIEKKVFQAPEFIKKVPVQDRPAYIRDRLWTPGSLYFTSDYSSFEALFVRAIMDAVEFVLYKWFTKFLPDKWFEVVERALGGINVCLFKWFRVTVEATRMSGDMCTSLGNGFSNLMFMEFMCSTLGSECIGVVEGDDGLFSIRGVIPTAEDFAKLGLIIKCEVHENLETASFCGIVFDNEDGVNVTDPLKVLASTSWLSGKYALAKQGVHLDLLRCKGLSLLYQYPKCPIIVALARYILRVTRGRDLRRVLENRNLNSYEREWLADILDDEKRLRLLSMLTAEIPDNTRLLVERLYGISWENQLATEKYLDGLTKIQPLSLDWLIFPEAWYAYDNEYFQTVPRTEVDRPVRAWYKDRKPCSLSRTSKRRVGC